MGMGTWEWDLKGTGHSASSELRCGAGAEGKAKGRALSASDVAGPEAEQVGGQREAEEGQREHHR